MYKMELSSTLYSVYLFLNKFFLDFNTLKLILFHWKTNLPSW